MAEDKLALTAVVGIVIEERTGKEDSGKKAEREAVLAFLEGKAEFPDFSR